jgi:hypothetical protein
MPCAAPVIAADLQQGAFANGDNCREIVLGGRASTADDLGSDSLLIGQDRIYPHTPIRIYAATDPPQSEDSVKNLLDLIRLHVSPSPIAGSGTLGHSALWLIV